MPKVIFRRSGADEVELEIPVGTSLMRAATDNGIEQIVGDCGGALSCATCHVYVDTEFLPLLPLMSANEDQMLDYTAASRHAESRLSCQVVMSEELDGLRVTIADPQV